MKITISIFVTVLATFPLGAQTSPTAQAESTAQPPGSTVQPESAAIPAPAIGSPVQPDYQPITRKERVEWVRNSVIGPSSIAGGAISAGWGTLFNRPEEYGPHWDGFGKRYGMRLTGVATSATMEASLGMLWGEDPRYFRAGPEASFKGRVVNILKGTVLAKNSNGENQAAYARYFAIYSSNYLSNTWRADSEATSTDASIRVGIGFLSRMASNTFAEFWPDVKQKVFRRK